MKNPWNDMILLLPLQEFMFLTSVQGKLYASAPCSLFYVDSLHAAWIFYQVPPKLLCLSICIELMVALARTIPLVSPPLSLISTSTLSAPSYDVAIRYCLEVLFLNMCDPLHMILPLENLDLSLLDICPVGVTFLFAFFPLEVSETTFPLDYSVLLNNLCIVLLSQMRLLDCNSSPIQPPLHPSRRSNVLNLSHTSVSYGHIHSMPKRKFQCSIALSSGRLGMATNTPSSAYKSLHEYRILRVSNSPHLCELCITLSVVEQHIPLCTVERVSHRDTLKSFVQKSENLEKQCLTQAIKSYCELRVLPYQVNKTVVF
ncbi:hypothetical protein BHM03_00008468 [Ensete ventricosum]|nr:hypothetical protein BHM03_00008468 [Ensete ventricosum]